MPSQQTRTRSYSKSSSRSFSSLPSISGVVKVTAAPLTVIPDTKSQPSFVSKFLDSLAELKSYRDGKPVIVDGQSLSIPAVAAASRYLASVQLDQSPEIRDRLNKARKSMSNKVNNGVSIYGVSTGFGGSADTRTDQPLILGHALLQMQHAGVLPSSMESPLEVLPLLDPMGSTTMPESWVRGAILIRMNSLIRGHSGVRWELIEKMNQLLNSNIVPVVPLRGSISASGDLSPLSYVAGTLCGNPSIRVFDGAAKFGSRTVVSSRVALEAHGIEPIPLASKEHLGILNGTAFSAAVGSLVLHDAVHMALLAQVLTAMGTEALAGTRGSFDAFIHKVARPHPGQVESAQVIWDLLEGSKFAVLHEEEVTVAEDDGKLRQDRYPIRTAPQFIGPQLEDMLSSLATVTQECNSTTDNPLIDGETGVVHNGGNFQAMAVTNAMEKTRLSLHHFGKLLFAQCAELIDPSMNRGLPPNLASTDPSLDYHAKGIDIANAAYVAELGYLANPVSTHIQSAEMHNQAVNSLALISGRATINSLEVLSILVASYLYLLCQALDLRAMQKELNEGLGVIVADEVRSTFSPSLSPSETSSLINKLTAVMEDSLDHTTTVDVNARMIKVAASSSTTLVDFFTSSTTVDATQLSTALSSIPTFRSKVSARLTTLLKDLRLAYLSGQRGPAPASRYLNKSRPGYEFVRLTLGIKMHGSENLKRFENGHGYDEQTVGQHISLVHEAIRDGKLQPVVASLFA